MIKFKKHRKLAGYLMILSLSSNIFSCTGIFLKTKNNSYIYGRTLEFGADLKSEILFIPRNYKIKSPSPSGKLDGLNWTTKFATVGANAFNVNTFVDGVNEKGLAGGLFYFPGYAQYQEVKPSDYKKSIPMWQLLTWILTNFSNVDQIKTNLPKIKVSSVMIPGLKFPGMEDIIPAHLIVHDTNGKSIVVEYVKGKLFIHDNPLGIITNSPDFNWHITNLSNYMNLSPYNAKTNVINGIKISGFGQGSGMLGLPGDFTPPSRFVRAMAFNHAAQKAPNEQEGVFQAFHILNNFDIPKGIVRDKTGDSDFTRWTSVTDLKNRVFYFRPYDNFQLQKIDLNKFDLNGKVQQTFSMKMEEKVIELNSR